MSFDPCELGFEDGREEQEEELGPVTAEEIVAYWYENRSAK